MSFVAGLHQSNGVTSHGTIMLVPTVLRCCSLDGTQLGDCSLVKHPAKAVTREARDFLKAPFDLLIFILQRGHLQFSPRNDTMPFPHSCCERPSEVAKGYDKAIHEGSGRMLLERE